MAAGTVEGIYVAPRKAAPVEPREHVSAVAGSGIEGARKFVAGERTRGHDLTLIEAEAVESLAPEIELAPGDSRRNVVTRGIDLNALVGKRFKVGEVECVGEELCHPCSHLEKLTQPGELKGLVNRGGLCARIVNDGEIAVGDPVRELG